MKYSMRVTCRFLNPVINDRIADERVIRSGFNVIESHWSWAARACDNSPAILLCTHCTRRDDTVYKKKKKTQRRRKEIHGKKKKRNRNEIYQFYCLCAIMLISGCGHLFVFRLFCYNKKLSKKKKLCQQM